MYKLSIRLAYYYNEIWYLDNIKTNDISGSKDRDILHTMLLYMY